MKLGVYGGTFNPVHQGHVHLAAGCARALGLERVIVVPGDLPPHKQVRQIPSAAHRLEMVKIAFSDPLFCLDTLEIDRGGVNYTSDTLHALRYRHPEDELYLIMGSDMFYTLESWHHPADILQNAVIVTGAREEGEYGRLLAHAQHLQAVGGRCQVVQLQPLEISSTRMRQDPDALQRMLPPGVYEYIRQNGLYGCDVHAVQWPVELFRQRAEQLLRPKRYRHSLAVADMAKQLARWHGVDEQMAFAAGMAHDLCKHMPEEQGRRLLEGTAHWQDAVFRQSPHLWHGPAAAQYLRRELKVLNLDILNAVRYHSTGRAGMTSLEKVIFLADLVSADRQYPDVAEMRALSFADLDRAMLGALGFTIGDLLQRREPVYRDTFEAYNELCCKLGGEAPGHGKRGKNFAGGSALGGDGGIGGAGGPAGV